MQADCAHHLYLISSLSFLFHDGQSLLVYESIDQSLLNEHCDDPDLIEWLVIGFSIRLDFRKHPPMSRGFLPLDYIELL